jgi:hypothetical protein
MGPAAPLLPFIAIGLSATSTILGGVGEARGTRHEAEQAEIAARVGDIQADQLDADYRREFSTTLANIRAIQASAGAPVNSPSSQAYVAAEEAESTQQRQRAVTSARLGATQARLDAIAYRRAARGALFGAAVGALGGAAQGYSLYAGL